VQEKAGSLLLQRRGKDGLVSNTSGMKEEEFIYIVFRDKKKRKESLS